MKKIIISLYFYSSFLMGYFLTEQKLFKKLILLRFGVKIWRVQKKSSRLRDFLRHPEKHK